MNDRALRQIAVAMGGIGNGFPREDGFDIIAASEIMAVFALAFLTFFGVPFVSTAPHKGAV